MKRTLLTLAIAAIAIPTLAQYDGEEGFYRIRNKGTAQRYISIVNDRVYSGFKNIGLTELYQFQAVNALRTVKDPVSDPGTVLYINGSSNNVSLEGQGMKTKDLLKGYQLAANGSQLCSDYKGTMIYLLDDHDADTKKNATVGVGIAKVSKEAGQYASWDIIKIDNTKEYFAVKPDITVGDKYYTTLYTSFAYQLSEGMKAYYVSEHEYSDSKIAEPQAVLTELTDKVPAATPVIIECSSNKEADNKLIPLISSEAPAAVKDNQLKGIYFCYVKYSFDDKSRGESTTQGALEERNVTEYNSSTMRVLGVVNGKLALTEAKDTQLEVSNKGKFLLANKAYFPIKSTEASATKNGILLVDKSTFDNAITAIDKVTNEPTTARTGVYTLAGVQIKAENSTEGLSNGIYIINGKKVIVR